MTNTISYGLTLADGSQFSLESSSEKSAVLLEQFARASRLEKSQGIGRCLLVKTGHEGGPACPADENPMAPYIALDANSIRFYLFRLSQIIAQEMPHAILLHGALIEYQGRGIMLIAPSGTGKSTACRRLPNHWRMLSDDLTLVVRDLRGGYWAHPMPTWSLINDGVMADSWDVQSGVPLFAILHLFQADHDSLSMAGLGEATILLTKSAEQALTPARHTFTIAYSRALRLAQFEKLQLLARSVFFRKLNISLHGKFWEIIQDEFFNQARLDTVYV